MNTPQVSNPRRLPGHAEAGMTVQLTAKPGEITVLVVP
jgi:hypothetical protein